ncbi:MAG: ferrochelatase [Alphaproteobacteria bacterium]|nr:ferrochelatase [Alphaproteobacteria bacterium]
MSVKKVAVVLFNLGGPDSLESVRPFLFNLFNDPAILRMPNPMRWMIAQIISRSREEKSQGIYALVGGRSPLLPSTQAQADALQKSLSGLADQVSVHVCMQYWHPMAKETVAAIKAEAPDRVVLLPLYPQFSTTTAGTSLKAFHKEALAQGLTAPIDSLCCFPHQAGFLAETVENIHQSLAVAARSGKPRLLLSAHGLPERTIQAGDPYQWQVEQTAKAIVDKIGDADLDHVICYQSRVGPVKWIGPFIEDEIKRAGLDKVPVVIAPISFVSEHVETLVEIEQEMRELALEVGVPGFERVPAVATGTAFIEGLADMVRRVLARGGPASEHGERICPKMFGECPMPHALRL